MRPAYGKLGILGLMLLLCTSCGTEEPSAAPDPVRQEYSEDYTDAAVYRVVGWDLDLEAMDTYPQRVDSVSEGRDGAMVVDLSVKNQTYYFLEPVPIDGRDYSEEIAAYLKPSEKVTWEGDDLMALLDKVDGGDVFAFASNAAYWAAHSLEYDGDLARRISNGECDTLNAEEALARGGGTCSEYTNLFLALMRARGIPARFETGICLDGEGKPMSSHAWASFFLDGYGWIPADPQIGSVGIYDNYIRLELGLDFADIGKAFQDYGCYVTLAPT